MDELTLAETKTTSEKKSKAAKSSAKTTATKRKSSAPKSPRSKKAKSATIEISAEQRLGMIAETAYFKAEKRGFSGGNPLDDWLAAETEIDALLATNPAQQANA
jgi:hypothetical protein